MKKVITIILTLIVALAIGFGCYKFYDYEINKEVEINDEKLFDKENYPKVDASLAIHPLVNSIAANFMQVDESELDYEIFMNIQER